MKLLTIGDSLSQGFMSGAAARTDLCYSTLIARQLGLVPRSGSSTPENVRDNNNPLAYYYRDWPLGGFPYNIERLFRLLAERYGEDNVTKLEWAWSALRHLDDEMERTEYYYEKGEGAYDKPYYPEYFHNIAYFGANVCDAWKLTPNFCKSAIQSHIGAYHQAGPFGNPNNGFFRSAYKVLNPSLRQEYQEYSQLQWLKHHVAHNGGVENLILWLGANNVLGTILHMERRRSDEIPNTYPKLKEQMTHTRPVDMDYWELAYCDFNLWTPEHFYEDYAELIRQVSTIMQEQGHKNWRVFVGNVPSVSVAPIARGVGSKVVGTDGFTYYDYYTYFPFDEAFARRNDEFSLQGAEVMEINSYIVQYNEAISRILAEADRQLDNFNPQHFYLVDINTALNRMAKIGPEPYHFPPALSHLNLTTHYYYRSYAAKR